jgi:hypothetical protein
MATDSPLPAEAFRYVHRMFFVPHTCHDLTMILTHSDFLSLLHLKSKFKSKAMPLENEKPFSHIDSSFSQVDSNNNTGYNGCLGSNKNSNNRNLNPSNDNEENTILKIQASPRSLKIFLTELIQSFYNDNHGRDSNSDINVDNRYDNDTNDNDDDNKKRCYNESHNNADNGDNSNTDNDNSDGNSNPYPDREAKSNTRSEKKFSILKSNLNKNMINEYTHILQCVYSIDDGE